MVATKRSAAMAQSPLLRPDAPVDLDLNQALRTAYRRAHYDLRIDYRAPCDSPLAPADAEWA
jgi:hypothetical protein